MQKVTFPCVSINACKRVHGWDMALPWPESPWQFLSLTSDVWVGRSWAHIHRTSAWDKHTRPPVLVFVQVTCAVRHAGTCGQTHRKGDTEVCKNTNSGTQIVAEYLNIWLQCCMHFNGPNHHIKYAIKDLKKCGLPLLCQRLRLN